MSTHCDVYFETEDGKYIGTYCHYDGYPSYVLPILLSRSYDDLVTSVLLAANRGGFRYVETTGERGEYLDDSPPEVLTNPEQDMCSMYVYVKHRDGTVKYRSAGDSNWIKS